MLKARSKSKIKNSIGFLKKDNQQKNKKNLKEPQKKVQDKQNHIAKFSMTAVQSKKKVKHGADQDTSRSVSPLCINKKKTEIAKIQDEKFIQKLFSHQKSTQKSKRKKDFFVQRLIQGLVPIQSESSNSKSQFSQHHESTDVVKQLHLKNQQVASLRQQIQELKLQLCNFTFKVFDLTVLCRKFYYKSLIEEQSIEFNRKTDQVIAYLDSLIRHWKLQQKIQLHCQKISKRISIIPKPKAQQTRKRCHTQSLKIPIQQYLQSLQNTNQKIFQVSGNSRNQNIEQQESEQIMKILSRRSSGLKKQQEQIYVVIKGCQAKNQHQLEIKPGEKISVLQRNSNNRWLGLKEGKIGYFPRDCLF